MGGQWGALGIKLCEGKSSCRAVPTEVSANARSSLGARWPFSGDLEKVPALGLEWSVLPELGPWGTLGGATWRPPLEAPSARSVQALIRW